MDPAYRTTVFEVPVAPPLTEFWIVTAYNPGGHVRELEANQAADEVLRHALETAGHSHLRITGRSPDGTHREPGWAVADEATAHELARRHQQVALYQVRGDRLLLLATGADGTQAEDLGSWAARQAGCGGDLR